jgi:hypothetical protein
MFVNRKTFLTVSASVLLGLCGAATVRAEGTTIYVAPDGNDSWSGKLPAPNDAKSDGPVATPAKARDLVRALKVAKAEGPVRVELRGGFYALAEPLTLTPADSGTAQAPVVWSAYKDEHPVLSGGQRLTGWTKTTVNGHDAWTVKLPGGAKDFTPRELWLDGKRLSRARFPKQGTLRVVGLSDKEKHDNWFRGVTEFRFEGNDVKAWPSAADGEAIVANRWAESHLPITSIDEANHVIHFGKRSVFVLEPDDRYWVENVKENLTEPGEFTVDPRERSVTLIPPAGVDPNAARVVAPRLASVLRLEGRPTDGQYVEHVSFHGLRFAHTEWFFDGRSGGRGDQTDASGFGQAAIGVPGAVSGRGVRSCTFVACSVAHTGTYGIDLAGDCQDNRIDHCTLTDLGAGGIKIGTTNVPAGPTTQSSGNVVSDCTIADGGNLWPSCVAVWIGQSPGNTIAHNDIHGFWYTAISIGWTWGYSRSAAQKNIVDSNHIHHIGTKADGVKPILSDMGCVYTLGDQEGTVIRNNHFHDVAGLKYGGWGIYFDEGTTHILAENNLVYRTTHGGFHQHYGKENTVRNNILAFARDGQVQRTRVEAHRSFTFENNIVLWEKGPLFTGDWSKLTVAFDGNTYWRTDGGTIQFAGKTFEKWQKAGMDVHSKIADPHLASPTAGDFALTAASQPALAGFKPFDVSNAGPRKP